jgi:hypothetical protein
MQLQISDVVIMVECNDSPRSIMLISIYIKPNERPDEIIMVPSFVGTAKGIKPNYGNSDCSKTDTKIKKIQLCGDAPSTDAICP